MARGILHNSLFVAVLVGNKTMAIEILKILLGKIKSSKLDFRTLKFEGTVFIDAEGNERRADAIISVMTKDGRLVLFLIEHKSYQDKTVLTQLLSYQTILYQKGAVEVVPIVISTAKKKWRITHRFRLPTDNLCGEVTLDFGYLLLDLFDYNVDSLRRDFPKSYPYLLALVGLQRLNKEAIEDFFVASLDLPDRKRTDLLAIATTCLAKYDSNFGMDVLEKIEAGCIENVEDRLMRTIKLGFEGLKEESFREGRAKGKAEGKAKGKAEGKAEERADVAIRMLKKGFSDEIICQATGLKRAELTRLKRKRA